MISRAYEEAKKREPYINHHFNVDHLSNEDRNVIGFLGEFACCELFGYCWEDNIRNNYYTIDNGDIKVGKFLIDVKTETLPKRYFEDLVKGVLDDDGVYGRRLIMRDQVPLLPKYDIVIFGAFIRDAYDVWYPLGFLSSVYIQKNYTVTEVAPFGGKYPAPALPVRTSKLSKMNKLVEYARAPKKDENVRLSHLYSY